VKRSSYSGKKKFSDLSINKGVELLMGGRRKPRKGNFIKFAKMVSLFGREIHFSFELSLLIKKKSLGEGL
jgi:hypothetical protein